MIPLFTRLDRIWIRIQELPKVGIQIQTQDWNPGISNALLLLRHDGPLARAGHPVSVGVGDGAVPAALLRVVAAAVHVAHLVGSHRALAVLAHEPVAPPVARHI